MKVESEKISSFLDIINYLVNDVYETVRMGDDGMKDCVKNQVDDIAKKIEEFKVIELTTITIKKSKDPYYVEKFAYLIDNKPDIMEHNETERRCVYKAQLYGHIKKNLREMSAEKIAAITNDQLAFFLETECIDEKSRFIKMILSNDFYYSSQEVFTDIANELIEERTKNPQSKLF
jgi:hypothetical protein